MTDISGEGTEVGEFKRLVWGCAASIAETEGGKKHGKTWRTNSWQMPVGVLARPLN